MGKEIHIRLKSDKYDDKELAPFLGRNFEHEIAGGNIFTEKQNLIDNDDLNILFAQYYEDLENEELATKNPFDLRTVLKKVRTALEFNTDLFPYEIVLDTERMESNGLQTDLIINNSRCWIKGDSYIYNCYKTVEILNFPMESNTVREIVDYSREWIIEDKIFYFKKVSRFERYKDSIDSVINFCKIAEEKNEQVYWLTW